MNESRIDRVLALGAYFTTLAVGFWWSVNRQLGTDYASPAQRAAARGVAFTEGPLLLAIVSLGHLLVFLAILSRLPRQPLARLCLLEGLIGLLVLAALQRGSPIVWLTAPTVLPLLVYGTLLVAGRLARSGVAEQPGT